MFLRLGIIMYSKINKLVIYAGLFLATTVYAIQPTNTTESKSNQDNIAIESSILIPSSALVSPELLSSIQPMMKFSTYNSKLDPQVGCSSWSVFCDIKFGLQKAVEGGTNGIMVSGYAYHLLDIHNLLRAPTVYYDAPGGGVYEVAPGLGYTRTFYNPQYNSSYSLTAYFFADSFGKPEYNFGYVYQKYINLNDSGDFKWGFGYSPLVTIKPSFTQDAPIPIPMAGLVSSLKYKNFTLILGVFTMLFFTTQYDF